MLRFENLMKYHSDAETPCSRQYGRRQQPSAFWDNHGLTDRNLHPCVAWKIVPRVLQGRLSTCLYAGYVSTYFLRECSFKNSLPEVSRNTTSQHRGAHNGAACTKRLMFCAISEGGYLEKFLICKLRGAKFHASRFWCAY